MAQEQESRGGAWRALRQKWTGRTAEKGGADAEAVSYTHLTLPTNREV